MLNEYDFLGKLSKYKYKAPLLLRLVTGLVFILAGYGKLTALFGGGGFWLQMILDLGFPLPIVTAYLVALIEFVGGIALILGLMTRYFSLLLSVIMTVAILKARISGGLTENGWSLMNFFNGARLDFLLLATLLALVFWGAGKLSLDKKFHCK